MNIKTIILGCTAVSIAIGGVLLNNQSICSSDEASYIPRNIEKKDHKSVAGYLEYMNSINANQITGTIDPADVARAEKESYAVSKRNNKAAIGLNWEQVGPDNVGGRTRAVWVDNQNSNIIYAGSVAGGLFISKDNAGTWTPVNDLADNLSISSITQTASGRVFFGTESSFEQTNGLITGSPGFRGNGLYEYDRITGDILPVVNFNPVGEFKSGGGTLNALAAKGERLYAGTNDGMLYADPDGSGKYPNDFSSWFNPIRIAPGSGLKETKTVIDIDLGSDGSMVVCFSGRLYYSKSDADDSFRSVNFPGSSRMSAAIAPSDPNYIYAVATNGDMTGFYFSNTFTNDVPNFDVVIPGGIPSIDPFLQNDGTGPQGSWNQCIAVDPKNKERCIVGGIQLYEFNLVPQSNPIGGDWIKIAHLSEALGTPGYVHADKHAIYWTNDDNVYIGSDGGIAKSIDGGKSWTENNLGYNVNTFFTVATNANGWIVGGSQDNGSQMITFGDIPVGSPISALQVLGGDGFDSEFSNLGDGITFNTQQFGPLFRSAFSSQGGGFSTGTFFDGELADCALGECGAQFRTSIGYWESPNDPLTRDSIRITFDSTTTLVAGTPYTYKSLTNNLDLFFVPSTTVVRDTSDTLMWPDYIQHKMAFGGISGRVYVTRQAANLGAIDIDWALVASNASSPSQFTGTPTALEFAPDGNSLFVGSSSGLYRIDNLSMANDSLGLDVRSGSSVTTCTRIATFGGRQITGVAIDPNNGNNVIVTLGNYGNTNYVYRSTTALTASSSTGFSPIQGPVSPSSAGYLPRMPLYDAEIDFNDKNKVVIGSAFGAWSSDNAFTASGNSVEWYEDNNGLAHVPVFQIRQQSIRGLPTSGAMYAGTHGRGFYRDITTLITGIDDLNENIADNTKFVSDLNIYPNPLKTIGRVSFKLQDKSRTIAKIYNLSGSLVKTIDFGLLSKGDQNQEIDVNDLSVGSYVISIESGSNRSVSKFIVTR